MSKADFINQVEAMGYSPQLTPDKNGVFFDYEIEVGRLKGKKVKIGFLVGEDFPMNPPSGPHFDQTLMPLNPVGGTHPTCGIHQSPSFGSNWQYWSRPFHGWQNTDRTVKAYFGHIRHLLDTI